LKPIEAEALHEISYSYLKEVFWMATQRLCRFYRDFCKLYADSESSHMDKGIGRCDLDCDQTTCKGGLDSCQKSDILKRYYFEQIKREGGLEWERKRNVFFFENLKS
jgi:hypothetical protein